MRIRYYHGIMRALQTIVARGAGITALAYSDVFVSAGRRSLRHYKDIQPHEDE